MVPRPTCARRTSTIAASSIGVRGSRPALLVRPPLGAVDLLLALRDAHPVDEVRVVARVGVTGGDRRRHEPRRPRSWRGRSRSACCTSTQAANAPSLPTSRQPGQPCSVRTCAIRAVFVRSVSSQSAASSSRTCASHPAGATPVRTAWSCTSIGEELLAQGGLLHGSTGGRLVDRDRRGSRQPGHRRRPRRGRASTPVDRGWSSDAHRRTEGGAPTTDRREQVRPPPQVPFMSGAPAGRAAAACVIDGRHPWPRRVDDRCARTPWCGAPQGVRRGLAARATLLHRRARVPAGARLSLRC